MSSVIDLFRIFGVAYTGKTLNRSWGFGVSDHAGLYRFHLMISGASWLEVEDIDHAEKLGAGDFAIVTRGRAHALRASPDTPVSEVQNIPDTQLSPAFDVPSDSAEDVNLLCGYFSISQSAPPTLLQALPDVLVLRGADPTYRRQSRLLTELIRTELMAQDGPDQTVLNRATELLCHFAIRSWVERVQGGPALLSDRRLHNTLTAIQNDPAAPWSVDALARLAGKSRTAFAVNFKEVVGVSPMAYVANCRHELAKQLLLESERSVDEIASMVGYHDTSSFARAFRGVFGLSPTKFRNKKNRRHDLL